MRLSPREVGDKNVEAQPDTATILHIRNRPRETTAPKAVCDVYASREGRK